MTDAQIRIAAQAYAVEAAQRFEARYPTVANAWTIAHDAAYHAFVAAATATRDAR